MRRRNYIKTIALGSLLPLTDSGFGMFKKGGQLFSGPQSVNFSSDWQNWPNMKWAGPEYWGNRLQDWIIEDGKLVCDVTNTNRTLHVLSVRNAASKTAMEVSVQITPLNHDLGEATSGCAGILVGAKGKFEDYRSAAVFGKGLSVGLSPQGELIVGENKYDTGLDQLPSSFHITFKTNQEGDTATVKIRDDQGTTIIEKENLKIDPEDLVGNLALLADFKTKSNTDTPSISFENWHISSAGLYEREDNLFGPVCFAQYTLNKKKLKLTAQFAPFEAIDNHEVRLEFKNNGQWKTHTTTHLDHPGRAINFQIEAWESQKAVPYRVIAKIPLKNETREYVYEGTIQAEPKEKETLNVAVFSCNAHYGFPDQDIPDSLEKLDYDLSLFLGDQFYEGTGGYGAMREGDFDKLCLDYLRKWMMFGWSYREIFRHKPCAIIPDDHDVYHGNIWGEGGKLADITSGHGSQAQDTGGYKMKPGWVNMVQFTQTSHLPDAFDPTPIKHGIGVYYTHWNYGGVSFAIIEDRKFKSAPKAVLPEEADVFNGFIRNPDFDIKKYADVDAELLGERQEKFLEEWVEDWSEGAQMKILCSQTNFATVATLPKGNRSDSIVPSLYIPEKGEYIEGDAPTVDMDSNGWPQRKRNKALELIRKGFTFHIAGDQHLGTFIQYGVQEHGDSGFAFTGPALNNLWPRRFWPPVDASKHSFENPAYPGDYEDGFGNKISVKAVANPHNLHQEPAILHNRANGFGIVTVNKKERSITTSCYKRFKDVTAQDAQYPGWPITVSQEDQLLSKANFSLPKLQINSDQKPIIRVLDEQDQLVYSLPLAQNTFQPKVFTKGKYRVELYKNGTKVKELQLKTTSKDKKVTISI